jgi:hypothetical protein
MTASRQQHLGLGDEAPVMPAQAGIHVSVELWL